MLRSIILAASAAVLSLSALAQTAASAPAAAVVKAAVVATAAAPTGDVSEGKVAYYGKRFAGRKTASGKKFNPGAMTMAHKSLPFGTKVRVTNLKNNKSVVVRVNDRGPTTADRVGDLSLAAAKKIRMVRAGVIDAELEVLAK